MKVIHLALSAKGGAGIAAARGVQALRDGGIEAEFWTADGSGTQPALRRPRWTWWRIWLDRMPTRFYPRRKIFSVWSNNWQPSRLAAQVRRAQPDLVHLHWIGGGFLSLGELAQLPTPLVWTMHDAWAFTGGCHYPAQCQRFTAECGACPQLGSQRLHDLSWRNLRTKRARLADMAAVVSPSRWLADLAATSGAVPASRIRVVPYALDGTRYVPHDFSTTRQALDLPADAIVLVAGAQDLNEPRKGCHLLRDVMARFKAPGGRRVILLLFGEGGDRAARDWPCEVRWLGTLRQESEVARVCSAADMLLIPSLQDNLPNIALEAQASGCPVVGFDSGGLREIIVAGRTGALAANMDAASLAEAITRWLAAAPPRTVLQARCREQHEANFAPSLHVKRLGQVYEELLRNI